MRVTKPTNVVALFGFLTALVGLFQVMWTQEPWWVRDRAEAPVATSGDGEPVVEQSVAPEEPTRWGYYLMVGGVVVGGSILGYELARKRRAS